MNADKPRNSKSIDTDREQRAIDMLEEMWDRELAIGDDKFFESAARHRSSENKGNEQHQGPQRRRRRGKQM